MENKVQLCGKYSTVMQIVVIVLGVKFLSLTTVTTDAKQKHLGRKKVRGQSEAICKKAGATKSFDIS